MQRIRVLATIAAIAVRGSAAIAAPPVEAYGNLPSVDLIAISPDGSKFALIVGDETRRQVQIRNASDQAIMQTLGVGVAKIRSLQWAGENHMLITASQTAMLGGIVGPKREYFLVTDFNLSTHKAVTLLSRGIDNVGKLNSVVADPTTAIIDGVPTAFLEGLTFPDSIGIVTLFRIDLDSGKTRVVLTGNPATRSFLVDAKGTVVAANDIDTKTGWSTVWTRGDKGQQVWLEPGKDDGRPTLKGFGRDNASVLIETETDEHVTYHELTIGHATMSPALATMSDAEPVADSARHLIGSVGEHALAVDYSFFAPTDAKLWAKITRAFPKAVVRLEAWSDDHRRIVLRVEGKTVGAAYYLLDTTTYQAAWLADEYSGIAPADLADKTLITYPAADGLAIPAYLTLPLGRPAKGLPLVVLPHGGPVSRDDPGFDWWAQALASRGYAVLQPQFRGSTGLGEKFITAGNGQWGRRMQSDLSDGVAFLARAGTIDPQRVAIVGGSYGGYAALAGVTLQHGIYRCAISLAGPADLRSFLAYEETKSGGAKTATMRFWQRLMAVTSSTDPALDAISPARQAMRADVPVLLIHGRDDTVVPFAQSKAMAATLAKAGHPATLVTLDGEDHWLSRSATRVAMLRATVNFLETNLPVSATTAVTVSPGS